MNAGQTFDGPERIAFYQQMQDLELLLARMLNLNGPQGRNAIPTFTAANFELTGRN